METIYQSKNLSKLIKRNSSNRLKIELKRRWMHWVQKKTYGLILLMTSIKSSTLNKWHKKLKRMLIYSFIKIHTLMISMIQSTRDSTLWNKQTSLKIQYLKVLLQKMNLKKTSQMMFHHSEILHQQLSKLMRFLQMSSWLTKSL